MRKAVRPPALPPELAVAKSLRVRYAPERGSDADKVLLTAMAGCEFDVESERSIGIDPTSAGALIEKLRSREHTLSRFEQAKEVHPYGRAPDPMLWTMAEFAGKERARRELLYTYLAPPVAELEALRAAEESKRPPSATGKARRASDD